MTKHTWAKRPILSQDDIPDLERAAALNEFEQGMHREDAEEQAYSDYRRGHHSKGAAHHLRGLKAAQEAGDLDEAHKHGALYSAHMGELGHDSMDKVPDDIKKLAEDEGKPKVYKYKSNAADQLLLD